MSISTETEKMLRLLSQVILADGHIHDTELKALIQGVTALGLSDEAGRPLNAAKVDQWFEAYLQELNQSQSKEKKDVVLTRLILSLAEWTDKQAVVETLEKISLADADFHKNEKRLISIVKAYWQHDGLNAPGSTIL